MGLQTMKKELLKSKTVWAGVSAVIAAVGGYCTGQMDIAAAIQTGLGGLIAIFLRDGIEKQ
jgi:hypothetical protein